MTQLGRKGESIDLRDHTCEFAWCEGTIWQHSHMKRSVVRTTGRYSDFVDGREVTVMIAYDETEDSRPQLLLHIGGDGGIDIDVSPGPRETMRLVLDLLAGWDAITQFGP